MSSPRTTSRLAVLVSLTLAASCANARKDTRPTPPDAAASRAPLAPKAWTERFHQRSLVVADEVRIEGPDGLLDHVASSFDPDVLTRTEKTTPDGFLTTIEHKRGAPPAEIKVQLDAFEVVALRRVVLLERPGPVDVVFTAQGDVLFTDLTTKQETRQPQLRIAGEIVRGAPSPVSSQSRVPGAKKPQ